MVPRVPAKLDGARLVLDVDDADVAELLAGGGSLGALGGHLVVVLRQLLHELLRGRHRAKSLGHERLHRDVLELDVDAALAGEDDNLPRDVGAAEVVPRVRLGVPELLGGLHDVAELVVGAVGVEDVGERSAEDALDLVDAVARVAEVVQGGEDGKTRADGALVEVVRVRVPLDVAQLLVVRERAGVGLLVGGDDVDTALQPILVVQRDILRGAAVDDDGVGRARVGYALDERLHVHRLALGVGIFPRVEVERHLGLAGEEHLGLPRHGDDAEVDVVIRLERRQLFLHLPEQGLAHEAWTDDADGHDRLGEVEPAVNGAESLGDVLLGHDAGDVVLGRSLGDGDDVDVGVGERLEEHGGDARGLAHVLADRREDGTLVDGLDRLDSPRRDGLLEALVERLDGGGGFVGAHGEADGVLGGRLRDHDDVASSLLHRLKHRVGGARHADHAGALDVDDGDVLDRREPLDEVDPVAVDVDGVHHAALLNVALVADGGAGRRLVEVVPQHHGDVVPHRR